MGTKSKQPKTKPALSIIWVQNHQCCVYLFLLSIFFVFLFSLSLSLSLFLSCYFPQKCVRGRPAGDGETVNINIRRVYSPMLYTRVADPGAFRVWTRFFLEGLSRIRFFLKGPSRIRIWYFLAGLSRIRTRFFLEGRIRVTSPGSVTLLILKFSKGMFNVHCSCSVCIIYIDRYLI